jgi:hypothetical protein
MRIKPFILTICLAVLVAAPPQSWAEEKGGGGS